MAKKPALEEKKYTPEEVAYVCNRIPDIKFKNIPVSLVDFWIKHKEDQVKYEKPNRNERL